MAIGSVGLKTHIWNNNIMSMALLAMFPALFIFISWVTLTVAGAAEYLQETNQNEFTFDAFKIGSTFGQEQTILISPYIFAGVAVWFAIAWFFHTKMIRRLTHSNPITRSSHPKLYNMLENMCISRGIPVPSLEIIESSALNAYASGLNNSNFSITLTSGLIAKLNDEEVEAVMAHELTHILNRDVRLLIISIIFVGIISTLLELVARGMLRGGGSNRKGGGAAVIAGLIAMVIAYLFATLIRLAISRKREFMADAGAVELTKNPEAMISALEKISGHDKIDHVDSEVKQMFIENSPKFNFMKSGIFSIFMTHPPIEKRIEVLKNFV
ncbi:MAG: protease [Magnetococcales bacterium]|nr:protease [Magnetococcales bacterium]